jgi:GST-like protein
MDTTQYTLYGAPGSGATAVHVALTLIGERFNVVDVAPWKGDDERARLASVNAMRQVPVLVTSSGETVTESAAILIWLGDRHPTVQLAPPIGDPQRAQYLRWMSFVSAAIYALYWIRDVPSRLAATEDAEAVILDRTADRIAECWRVMDQQMARDTPYLLGDRLTMLDLYVTVVSRWTPRRLRFYREAPRMAQVVRRVDADARLAEAWSARYPFLTGWESQGP